MLSLSNSAALKFGNIAIVYSPLTDAIAAIFIGIVCGLLGALFVAVFSNMGVLRKKLITTNSKKIAETLFFSIATTSTFFWLSAYSASNSENCVPVLNDDVEYFSFTCPAGTYNAQATLFFNTESGVIRALMNQTLNEKWSGFLIFGLTWYVFTIFTAGVVAPGGLFVPGMIIGCTVGQLTNKFKNLTTNIANPVTGQSYEIMGCGAMLASFTRQTYSLAVIMLETTQQINFFIPIVITILVSTLVGKAFNQSLYERALRLKQLPLLRNHVPKS